MVAKLPSKMVAINVRSMLKWKMTSATRLSHCATVFLCILKIFTNSTEFMQQQLTRKKIEYIFGYSMFSYQLHHQCNYMPEGHIEREKLLLFEILISRPRRGCLNDLFGETFGDVPTELEKLDFGMFSISVRGGLAGVFFIIMVWSFVCWDLLITLGKRWAHMFFHHPQVSVME